LCPSRAHLKAQNKPRPATRRRYESLWRLHLRPVLGELRVDRVKPAHVQAALDSMLANGAAARSVAQAPTVASVIFKFAVRSSLITTNPARETSKPTPQPPALTVPDSAELHALIDQARDSRWEIPVLLAATTGARGGEVLALRWERVDLDRGRVRIVAALQRQPGSEVEFVEPKTARARREVPIPAFVVERLREHRVKQKLRRLMVGAGWTDHDLVCDDGCRRSDRPRRVHLWVQRPRGDRWDARGPASRSAARRSDGDGRRGVSPTVTSRVLGHASEAFTMSVCQHPDEAMLEATADALADVFETPR